MLPVEVIHAASYVSSNPNQYTTSNHTLSAMIKDFGFPIGMDTATMKWGLGGVDEFRPFIKIVMSMANTAIFLSYPRLSYVTEFGLTTNAEMCHS